MSSARANGLIRLEEALDLAAQHRDDVTGRHVAVDLIPGALNLVAEVDCVSVTAGVAGKGFA